MRRNLKSDSVCLVLVLAFTLVIMHANFTQIKAGGLDNAPTHSPAFVADAGAPDSVYVSQVQFVSPPWPSEIEVPVIFWSDDDVSGWSLGLRPVSQDGSPFTGLRPTGYTHEYSVFNGSTIPFWTPFRYDAPSNTGLLGWVDFSGNPLQSPAGEMYRLVLAVEDPNIPAGTVVTLDTMSLSAAPNEIVYEVDNITHSEPMPFISHPDNVLFGEQSVSCGDFDGSGDINITDVVYLINYIFAYGPAPLDASVGDVNCDGSLNITDAVYMINYIFILGPAPCAACEK